MRLFNLILFIQLVIALPLYFFASLSAPGGEPSLEIPPFILHLTGSTLMCLSVFVAREGIKRIFQKRIPLPLVLTYIICLALIAEFGQLLVPDRSFNYFDIATNLSGVGLGLIIRHLANTLTFFMFPKSQFLKF